MMYRADFTMPAITTRATGVQCLAGNVCSAGACALTCQAGMVNCNGKCIDPRIDRVHCGAKLNCFGDNAGEVCDPGEVCSGGETPICSLSCQQTPVPLTNCGGICVDQQTDRQHCGGCTTGSTPGVDQFVCLSGEVCLDGVCQLSCQEGLVRCGSVGDQVCIDPLISPDHCGAKGNCVGTNPSADDFIGVACQGDHVCQDGACACLPGLTACGGGTDCVDTLKDRANCGDCGNPNTGAHICVEGEICAAGTCALSCPAGLTQCGPVGGEFCTNTVYDPENCGGCAGVTGTDCTVNPPPNTLPLCGPGGTCTYACKPNYNNSNADMITDGCESGLTCGKLIFLTSQEVYGDFGGLAAADAICTSLANGSNTRSGVVLAGRTFKAWLSDSTASPSTRFTRFSGPYLNYGSSVTSPNVVANGWSQLASAVHNTGIVYDQNGNIPAWIEFKFVWTGTRTDGTLAYSTCLDWTQQTTPDDSFLGGTTGRPHLYTDYLWTGAYATGGVGRGCQTTARFYCVEQ